MNNKTSFLSHAAIIAALYIVLTFLANAFGLASGVIQIRFSEALTILPFFTPAAIPGLFTGCLLANILTGCAVPDVLVGSFATLMGALFTYKFRKYKWMAPVPPIVSNAILIPLVLYDVYDMRPLWFAFVTVTIGEILSCGVLGMLLLHTLLKHAGRLFNDAYR